MTDRSDTSHQKQSPRWKAQKRSSRGSPKVSASGLHNDDAGIFVTCDKGQEARCLREMDDILSDYLHSHQRVGTSEDAKDTVTDRGDIENEVLDELEAMKSSSTDHTAPYSFVRLDIPCVSFIRMAPTLCPVSVVHRICEEAYSGAMPQRARYVKRLTPVSCMRKTLGNGLEQLCEVVLRPVFGDGITAKKFAIRPTIRNNDKLNRDSVIKTVADRVHGLSSSHTVDLANYDCLILVEVYRNVCGMSVIGQEFERLKRFNLSEIYQLSNLEASHHKNDST